MMGSGVRVPASAFPLEEPAAHQRAQDAQTVHLSDGTLGLRIRLPRPVVYSPNVTLRVEQNESGLLRPAT